MPPAASAGPPERACRSMSGCPQHTTPSSQPPLGWVTITHPHHPLYGQRVAIVRLRRGEDPDLIVRLPDGTHVAISMSLTDYAGASDLASPASPPHLLALGGLRQAVQLIERCRQEGRFPAREP